MGKLNVNTIIYRICKGTVFQFKITNNLFEQKGELENFRIQSVNGIGINGIVAF